MERTVFIPHLPTRQNPVDDTWVPTISLNPAAELGELKVICDQPSDAAPENIAAAMNEISKVINEFRSGDYIVMTGDPVLCAWAIHLALNWADRVCVLRWNREARRYDLLTIED